MNDRQIATTLRSAIVATALGTTTLLLSACGGSDASNSGQDYHHLAASLEIEAQSAYTAERRLPGVVLPSRVSELGFEIGGRITDVLVDEGHTVKPGQVLARLDTSLLESERAALEAQRSDLEARLNLNRKTLKRIESLKDRNFAADQRVDELIAERQQISASISRLSAELDGNQTRLDKSEVIAPYAGEVSRRYVDEGTVVDAGRSVLRLLEAGPMEARINVPTRFVGAFRDRTSVALTIGEQDLTGRVLAVGTDVERPTLTVPVRIEIPADSAIAGDLVYARIDEPVEKAGFWVPVSALRDGVRGTWQAYALVPHEQSLYRIENRDVQVVYLGDSRAYISGALTDREVIVADGLHRLVPGQIVRTESTNIATNGIATQHEAR